MNELYELIIPSSGNAATALQPQRCSLLFSTLQFVKHKVNRRYCVSKATALQPQSRLDKMSNGAVATVLFTVRKQNKQRHCSHIAVSIKLTTVPRCCFAKYGHGTAAILATKSLRHCSHRAFSRNMATAVHS